MQQRQNGRKMMYLGGGLIVLVLAAAFFMTRGGGSSSSTPAARTVASASSTPVVIALQAIPQGTMLSSPASFGQYFGVKRLPTSIKPTGAYSSVNQIATLAQSSQGALTTSQTIYQNTPVVAGMFTPLGQYRQSAGGAAFDIPYGYVGIAVNFDAVNSVIGTISPGDNIDIIASYHPSVLKGANSSTAPPKSAPAQTQYVLNDLRVLSVNGPPPAPGSTQPSSGSGGSSSTGSSGSSGSSSSNTSAAAGTGGGTLLVLVRYQQALVIQHLKDFGWQMSAVLRSAKQADNRTINTLPVTEKWFFVKTNTPFRTQPGY